MRLHALHGVIPPLGTPLNAQGGVDTDGLRRLTRHVLDGGVHGVFTNGSMGGFAFLTDTEQMRAIETVVDTVQGKVPVMAGLGELSTTRAVARAREIAQLGISHLSVLAPLFYLADQDQLFRYFCEIAAAIDIPMVIYDNPVLTKNPILPETILRLRAQIPHLVGVKESNQDCVNLQTLLDLTRNEKNFSVLTGSEFLIVVGLQMGVQGCVGGVHNLCPQVAVELYDAFLKGDIDTANDRQRVLTEVWQIFRQGGVWSAFEEALRYLGLCERAAGEPYVHPLSSEERENIRTILARHLAPANA
ncbi:MAG: dihydrodipicolinate synthase family protein [Acidobacteriota bacterium]